MSIENFKTQNNFENRKNLIEQRKKLAIEFGKFYPMSINILINPEMSFDKKKELVAELMKNFSSKSRKVFAEMYEKILNYFEKEIKKLDEIGGEDEKIKYFLNYPIIEPLKSKIKYFEIGGVIPVLDIDDDVYQKIYDGESGGFMGKSKDGFSYIAIRNLEDFKSKPKKKDGNFVSWGSPLYF